MCLTKEISDFLELVPLNITVWEKKAGELYCCFTNKLARDLFNLEKREWDGKKVQECYPSVSNFHIKKVFEVMESGEEWSQDEFDYEHKVKHKVAKYSLDDVFSFEEVLDFDARAKKNLSFRQPVDLIAFAL